MRTERPHPDHVKTRVRRAALFCMVLGLAGCAREVSMAEIRSPEQVDVTVQYSAVRSGARLFGDYSVVDHAILGEQEPPTNREPAETP